MQENANLNNETVLEQFLEMMLVERGVASKTIEAYGRDLSDHQQYLTRIDKNFYTANYGDLINFGKVLQEQGIKASSLARKNSALKQIYKFMLLEELREDNPAKLLATGKVARKLPKLLTQDEVTQLFDAIGKIPKLEEKIRLTCLLEILYGCGLRVSELVSLPMAAIIVNSRVVRVRGKGNKERVIPLSKMALRALKQYLQIRNSFLPKSQQGKNDKNYLFPSIGGKGHLTRQRFGQILKELASFAGIMPEKLSPHTLRHAFASHLLNNGAGLLSVQKMLGHADIATTQIYTHILDEKVKKFVIEQHPLTNIMQQEEKSATEKNT